MSRASVHILNVMTRKSKITEVACVIFLLGSAGLDELADLSFSNYLFFQPHYFSAV